MGTRRVRRSFLGRLKMALPHPFPTLSLSVEKKKIFWVETENLFQPSCPSHRAPLPFSLSRRFCVPRIDSL